MDVKENTAILIMALLADCRWPSGGARVPSRPQAAALPAAVPPGGWHAFRVPIGPRPTAGDAWVVLAFDPANAVTGDAVAVRVNGEPCGLAESAALAKLCPAEPAWRYRVPLGALRDGYNVIELQAQVALTVTWVELTLATGLRQKGGS